MNFKKFVSFMKHALLIAVVLTTVGLSGCKDDDNGPSVYNGTILQLISDTQFKQSSSVPADQALDSLVKYLNTYPQLTSILSTTTAQYTLFAPSNQAFISLLATPGFPPAITQIDPDIILGVLMYHIVPGSYHKSALTPGTSLTTLYPAATADDKIIVNDDGTLKTGATNQSIQISTADKLASNGVVHITASVLIPQSVGAALIPVLGKMSGTILLSSSFTYYADIILKADSAISNPNERIVAMLSNPSANATFFAAPNSVLESSAAFGSAANVKAYIASLSKADARTLMLNHYISGKHTVSVVTGAEQFTDGQGFETASQKTIHVAVGNPTSSPPSPYGVNVTFTKPDNSSGLAPIVSKDIITSNGVIQAIAGVLNVK